MSADMTWSGLDDLAKDLAALPGAVRAEFKPIVVSGAERIKSRVEAAHAARGVPDVSKGIRVETSGEASDISARVINPSPLGHLHEFGTADRYTARGAYRGRMPATPTFIPIAEEERARVTDQLAEGLQKLHAGRTLAVR